MDIIKKYFAEYSIVKHQFDSFNNFILFDIQNVIHDEPNIYLQDGREIRFGNVRFKTPMFMGKLCTPSIARQYSITYEFQLKVDLYEKSDKGISTHVIDLCTIPAMVGSVTCNLFNKSKEEKISENEISADKGGYFVINGKERVIIGQMKKTYNRIICYKKDQDTICETRSSCDETAKSSLITLKKSNLKNHIDLVIDKISYDLINVLHSLLPDNYGAINKLIGEDDIHLEETIYFLNSRATTEPTMVDVSQLFPHLGFCTNLEKAIFLCKMIRKLILVNCDVLQQDDKSNLAFKRVDMVGALCRDLFKMLWKQFIKSLIKEIKKRQIGSIIPIVNIKKKNIGLNFLYCFSSGVWGITKNVYKKLGVSEFSQNKVSSLTNLALLRKINIPVGKKDKNIQMRQIHPSSIFYICPFETPEGSSVGIRLSLSILATVSESMQLVVLLNILSLIIPVRLDLRYVIMVNGLIFSSVDDPDDLITKVDTLRITEKIRRDVSIFKNDLLLTVEIWCDSSRLIRPLIRTNKFTKECYKKSIKQLENEGILVYRDPAELETSYVSMEYDKESDYLELNPSCIMGVVAGIIPFSNHTQSPRVCYMANMIKQAIGVLPTLESRSDSTVYELDSVQKPLNTPEIAEILELHENPNGINAVVAVACYTGFNQEDSIILNKGALDRGLFRAYVKKTISCEIKNFSSFEEKIGIPEEKYRLYSDYGKLDETTGIIKKGMQVKKGDVVIGKVSISKTAGVTRTEDKSVVIKNTEEGIIHNVFVSPSLIKISILQVKVPEIGDKFCSGMAQKGTCGIILREEDMPFTGDGIIPDIIINPHCIPSRMTINQLMSCMCSKALCLSGEAKYSNGSAFTNTEILDAAAETLMNFGYAKDGTEVMYNGMTGEKINSRIFIGPVYYHRLTHLVSNKIFSSTNSNIKNKLTRQPLNGRSNDGGLRIGEMEKDCLLRHGILKFSSERLIDLSDKFLLRSCNICKGYYHVSKLAENVYMCNVCKSRDISTITIPYAAKLLVQELESMGLDVKLTSD
nr:MAG: DdRpII [Diabrotica toursvirus 3a]